MRKFVVTFVICLLVVLTVANAQELESAVSSDDLDLRNCTAWGGGQPLGAVSPELLEKLLGLSESEDKAHWSTGKVAGEKRHFRIAFRRPVPIGTIVSNWTGATRKVAALREGAEYPGRIDSEEDWREVPGGAVRRLDAGMRVRALRFTDLHYTLPWAPDREPSRLGPVLLLRGRFYDGLRLGGERWEETEEGLRWTGFWSRPLPLSGVVMTESAPRRVEMHRLPAADERHPLLVEDARWERVENISRPSPQVLVPEGTTELRGVRLVAGAWPGRTGRRSPRIVPLVPLDADEEPPEALPEPPFSFRYEMPYDGFMAIRVRREGGRDVRRLIAEVERSKGTVRETWDLKNDAGSYVEPGTYRWRGVACPPLKLTYEMTVYNAGDPPWRAPVKGGGWWMADHSPPVSVCAVGDHVFMGALGSEFGASLIATDLEGNKVWQDTHQGAKLLVSDGRYAYVVNDGGIIRVDPENGFVKKKILGFRYTDELPGHASGYYAAAHSGVAAREGLLAVSYDSAGTPWIKSTFGMGLIDWKRTFPPPGHEEVHDTELSPRQRIASAFLAMQSSQQSRFGDAPTKGPLAHTLVLALKKPVPVGSVLLPRGDIQVHALRPGKELPPRFRAGSAEPAGPSLLGPDEGMDPGGFGDLDVRFDEDVWVPLRTREKGQPVVAVPERGLHTKVLAFTGPDLRGVDYALVLDRRYRNLTPEARLVMLEGRKKGPAGWHTRRTGENPISAGDPAVAGYVWSEPVRMRGFALLRPMEWAGLAVDVWEGPAEAEITKEDFRTDQNWRQVRRYRKSENSMKFGWHTNRVVKGDFGRVRTVRALRVRIVEPPDRPAGKPEPGAGGFEALIALHPIGNDPDLPESFARRITVVDLEKSKIHRHLRAPGVHALAFGRDDVLYAGSAEGILRLDAPTAQRNPVEFEVVVPPERAGTPRAMALGADGALYVIDAETRHVRVFDPQSGEQTGEIGTPGGVPVGPYDPTRFTVPVAIDADRRGKIWVVEQHFQPKRITRWSADGELEKQFMGPTHYGGGGRMDPRDRTVVNHLGMKFRIDHEKKTWRLESILQKYGTPRYMPDRVKYYEGRRYLVGDRRCVLPFGDKGPITGVFLEENGVAVPVLEAGMLSGWRRYKRRSDLQQVWRGLNPQETGFLWSDLNRDAETQLDEVQLLRGGRVGRSPYVGDDFSLNYSGAHRRLRVREVTEDGVPVYDVADMETVPALDGEVMVTEEGETFVMGHHFLGADGQVQWRYPDRYSGVQASMKAPWGFYNRPPGVLSGSMVPIGHFRVGGEHLFCVGGNNGDYYAFTKDGLLAATILGGPRGYGRRFFAMPEAVPGETDLSGLRKTVEDFRGHVTRVGDQTYAIAGKNHVTVMSVAGLERMERVGGTFEVSAEDLERTRNWELRRAEARAELDAPKVSTMPAVLEGPEMDGYLVDWPEEALVTIRSRYDRRKEVKMEWRGALLYDAENLYVAGAAYDDSPLLNRAEELERIFQGGDALDVMLGVDPEADPRRQDPAPGDFRLVIGRVKGKALVVLYRYVAPRADEAEKKVFTSPMGETKVDVVRVIEQAEVSFRAHESGWKLEAAIPWSAIGLEPPPAGQTVRGDVGVLQSDQEGTRTVSRIYWANRSNVVLGDLPAEARVTPALWGRLRCTETGVGEEMEGLGTEEEEGADMPLPLDF